MLSFLSRNTCQRSTTWRCDTSWVSAQKRLASNPWHHNSLSTPSLEVFEIQNYTDGEARDGSLSSHRGKHSGSNDARMLTHFMSNL